MKTVDRDVAMHHCGKFYHKTEKNSDGTAVRCRWNGVCKTWKTRTDDFSLPVKYGLKTCFYLTPFNCEDWEITDSDWNRIQRSMLCDKLNVSHNIPDEILHDLALDKGVELCADLFQ